MHGSTASQNVAAGAGTPPTVLENPAMATNADDTDDGCEFVDLGRPHAFDADEVAEMPRPPVTDDGEYVTLYAVAARSGARPDAEGAVRDAARVLYLSLDGRHAYEEVHAGASARTPSKVRASVRVAEGHSAIATPAERVVGAHRAALEAHRELEGQR